jgi:hypothetical protein
MWQAAGERTLTSRIGAFHMGFIKGEDVDVESWLAAANTAKRLLCALGLERRSRLIEPPSLEVYSKQLEMAAK